MGETLWNVFVETTNGNFHHYHLPRREYDRLDMAFRFGKERTHLVLGIAPSDGSPIEARIALEHIVAVHIEDQVDD
jgi:hypothetical protein